jgi:purine nucleosidase
VLVYGDFGIDDTIALIFLLFCKDIEIIGIVADYGNVERSKVLRNLNFIKYLGNIHKIPIFTGAETALTGLEPTYYPEVHGPEGLGPIIPQIPKNIKFPIYAIEDLKPYLRNFNFNFSIVTLGRLSSLAALSITDLEIIKRCREVIVMGGVFFKPGNVTALAEANFYSDPYAINLIVQYAKNLTIIPLNITQSSIITPEMVNDINRYHTKKTGDPLGLLVKPLLDYYYNFYSQNYPGIKGSPIHDVVAIYYLVNPEAFQISTYPIKIIVEHGDSFGQSFADFRPNPGPEYKKHGVALKYDYDTFINEFLNTFKSYRKTQ